MTRALFKTFLLTSALVSLTACGSMMKKSSPKLAAAHNAPVVEYGASAGFGSSGVHTVLSGDTLYTIAQQYRLSVREIIDANNLTPPYRLANGTRVLLPPPETYKIKNGDNLPLVARTFSVSQHELVALNNLGSPYRLMTGQEIRLPRARPSVPPPEEKLAPIIFEPMSVVPPAPSVVMNHPVAVRQDSVAVETLPDVPPPGLKVVVPKQNRTVAMQDLRPPQPVIPAAKPEKVSIAMDMQPPPRSDGRFMLPVNGSVISKFGNKPGGLYNEGVNISAPRGTPVRAAENGKVVYVGKAVEGYGNLVLVKHADNYITAYAHLDKTLIKEGQILKRGQPLGTVGSTGNVDRPQVHFEIRKGRESVDPSVMT
jgi:murein DD-endopeptidase MepM/ murein hydrolase activator NlpD